MFRRVDSSPVTVLLVVAGGGERGLGRHHRAFGGARPSGGAHRAHGLPHEPTPLSFFGVVRREITILGSMICQDEFGEAVRLLEAGVVRTDRLVTRRFPLEAIADAFTAHRDSTAVKVAVIRR